MRRFEALCRAAVNVIRPTEELWAVARLDLERRFTERFAQYKTPLEFKFLEFRNRGLWHLVVLFFFREDWEGTEDWEADEDDFGTAVMDALDNNKNDGTMGIDEAEVLNVESWTI